MTPVPTARQFAHALTSIQPSHLERGILAVHYQAPSRTLTAGQAAEALGYDHHAPVNAAYGRLARKVGKALSWRPEEWEVQVGIVATLTKSGRHWQWHLRPEVATALENLGWVDPSTTSLPEETDDTGIYPEGARKRITVNAYERNSSARRKCVEHHGYACMVCGIRLSCMYGEIGKRYIHIHHLLPMSELEGEYGVDPVKDLRPVCPNCHAMIHRQHPPFTIEEMRRRLGVQ
jgi:predicted HNH restriction endonuclease